MCVEFVYEGGGGGGGGGGSGGCVGVSFGGSGGGGVCGGGNGVDNIFLEKCSYFQHYAAQVKVWSQGT